MLIQGVSFVLLFTYISASPFIVQTIYGLTPLNFSIMFAFIGVTLIISSQLTGKLVDYIDRLLLLRIMSTIQVIGVIIVSLTLLNHWTFWILSCGFVILVAPVTGIATLGFSIAMDESKGAKVVLQVCWDCFKLYLVASSLHLLVLRETVMRYLI